MVLERLNFKQNGQIDIKRKHLVEHLKKKGFTPYPRFNVVYKR